MAAPDTNGTTRHPWRAPLAVGLAVVAFPIGVAGVVSPFTHFGRHVEEHFFEMIALTLPLIALPAFLERGGILTRRIGGEGPRAELTAFTVAHVIIVAGSLVVGECAALYAVASNTSTTFLAMTCLVSGIFQVTWLSFNTALRIRAEGRDRYASNVRSAAERHDTFQG